MCAHVISCRMQNDNNAQPDTPPPTGGGCCSSIAAFLKIGPEVRLVVTIIGLDFGIALSIGRRERAS
jgi:hypothetical protein